MEIRKIKAQTVCDTVKKLFTDCNYFIGKDIMCALETARDNESSPVGKSVLSQIIENDKIAAREEVPLCQDTGMAVLFVEYGDRVVIEDGSFDEAVNEGVRRAYIDGYLRKSVVNDPVFDRINTKDNTPAIIHTKIVSGNQIKITAGGKGFGSENMSKLKMFTPSATKEDLMSFVLDTVKTAGGNPCPPMVVGIGFGGDFEQCAYLAKEALCREVSVRNSNPVYSEMEAELLKRINETDIGPQGFGGKTTALAVNIETAPTHIAGLPAAVNIGCHVTRHAEKTI